MSLFVGDAFDGDDWSLEQKMAAQKELLGISLEAHPLELLADQIAESGAVSTAEAAEKHGEHVIVAGIRQISRRTRTSRGETMLFLTLEDLAGTLDVIVFPDVYQRYRALLRSEAPFLISGLIEIDQDHGDPYLRADRVQVFR
jgi:DNA polymerase-3 subunit alpha